MNKLIYISLLAWSFLFVACDPETEDMPDIGAAPTTEDVSFTITPGDDDFTFVMTNTSGITGIAKWDLGNGSKASGNVVKANYSLPGEYTITLTLYARGGNASTSQMHVTTETNYAIFSDPKFIFLSGGVDDADGKTWVLDSLAQGHLGVGPAGSNGLEWWNANPLAKQGAGVLYDDELTFNIVGFSAVLNNHGQSYVKAFQEGTPGYTKTGEFDGDIIVNYNPSPGTWFIEEVDGVSYLTLNGSTPIFPAFDTGASNGKYEILNIEENLLELVCIGGDGLAWHYQLIPKGYAAPKVTFELSVDSGTEPNTYDFSLSNVVIPTGESITSVSWDFGNGISYNTDDYNEVVSQTYQRKGSFNVSVTIETSAGDFTKSQIINVESNHPDYVEFILDEMVIYSDFSEVELAPVLGENCSLTVVDNPEAIYPNRSSKVAMYSKDGQPWANAYMKLPAGFRFDLRLQSVFKLKVYGKAGDEVLLKLENTDKAEPWKTGTELKYTIQNDNTWEVMEFDFSGVAGGFDWTGEEYAPDVVASDVLNHDFYNVVRIMLNPGNGDGTHEFYFDDLAGPHVEGVKSGRVN